MLDILQDIAMQAGTAVMDYYLKASDSFLSKSDGSPLTKADSASHHIINSRLKTHFPNIPILSEEGYQVPFSERQKWNYFFLVDPLDGTKEFINKNGEFTVNIALISGGRPIAGVVYAPALNQLYAAEFQQSGVWKLLFNRKEIRDIDANNLNQDNIEKNKREFQYLRVVTSRSHINESTLKFISDLKGQYEQIETVPMGSSLKICLVATNKADIYPRIAPTMEWDTAAAHAIVLATGCQMIEHKTQLPIIYNKESLMNPSFIVSRTAYVIKTLE